MALWKLDDTAIAQLRQLPETGMGFQWITGRVEGRLGAFLIFNCELAVDLSEVQLQDGTDPAAILANGSKVMEALRSAAPAPNALSALALTGLLLRGTRLVTPTVQQVPSDAEAPQIAQTSGLTKRMHLDEPRRFHRYSAFVPDHRVDPATGDLLHGSYAVPDSEVVFFPTGFAAVGRLALPNLSPPSNHYVIKAAAGTTVEFGTVAPAFGQSGGGVEAFFPFGAANTPQALSKPVKIPDE